MELTSCESVPLEAFTHPFLKETSNRMKEFKPWSEEETIVN